jgi:hypothetical protein
VRLGFYALRGRASQTAYAMILELWSDSEEGLVVVNIKGLGMLVLISCAAFVMSGCSGSSAPAATLSGRNVAESQRALHDPVMLLAPAYAPLEGWCLTVDPRKCPGARFFAGPIAAETVNGSGDGTQAFVRTIVLVTGAEVAAVSVNGQKPIPTRVGIGLPEQLRAAVIVIRGGAPAPVPGFDGVDVPPPPKITALNGAGAVIPASAEPSSGLLFARPATTWSAPGTSPNKGLCELRAGHLPGLEAEGGTVVRQNLPKPTRTIGRPLLACVSSFYRLGKQKLTASVLVDASEPGRTPVQLPGSRSDPENPGVLDGVGPHGEFVAHRGGGPFWFVVAGGRSQAVRLRLLQHLNATLHI